MASRYWLTSAGDVFGFPVFGSWWVIWSWSRGRAGIVLRDPPERNMDGKKRADTRLPGKSQESSFNLWPCSRWASLTVDAGGSNGSTVGEHARRLFSGNMPTLLEKNWQKYLQSTLLTPPALLVLQPTSSEGRNWGLYPLASFPVANTA